MTLKKSVGRPSKMNYKILIKLADLIQHNTTITEACRYVGISRDTFYRHYKEELIFAEKIDEAKNNRNKVSFNFLTFY